MSGNSRRIITTQPFIHRRLPALVQKHLQQPYRKPIAAHNLQAFAQLRRRLRDRLAPLVLDSFCGTGYSTAVLARRHPNHLVVGIDKSASRLARHDACSAENYLLLQADCEAIWQQLAMDGLCVDYHYLLYPNPWPKPGHLQRRIHGHASFPLLLQLARAPHNDLPGAIVLRSNWQTYVEEFGLAAHLGGSYGYVSLVDGRPALTLFERKYRDSGHRLWQFSNRPTRLF